MPADVAARVALARDLIGTPFRLQGRDGDGLDCIGLIARVHGLTDKAPRAYALRGTAAEKAMAVLDRLFVRRAAHLPEAGDVVLMQPGLDQLHLGLWTGTSLIHAHAGLRRVVEAPSLPPHPLLGYWFQETY
jgi:lipoprotein Spr